MDIDYGDPQSDFGRSTPNMDIDKGEHGPSLGVVRESATPEDKR